MYHKLFIHYLLQDILVASKLLWNWNIKFVDKLNSYKFMGKSCYRQSMDKWINLWINPHRIYGDITLHLWGKYQGAKLLDHMVRVSLVFWEPFRLSSKWLYLFALLSVVIVSSCCSTSLPLFSVVSIPDFGCYSRCIVVSQ